MTPASARARLELELEGLIVLLESPAAPAEALEAATTRCADAMAQAAAEARVSAEGWSPRVERLLAVALHDARQAARADGLRLAVVTALRKGWVSGTVGGRCDLEA